MHLIVALVLSLFIQPPRLSAPEVRFLGECPKGAKGEPMFMKVEPGPQKEIMYLNQRGQIMFWTNATVCFAEIQLPKEMQ